MSAIEERIRRLLALADSPNENEAAAAAEKAQALMLRYGIEMATIAASGGERLAVDEHVVDGKVDPWRRMLAAAVARSAGGRVVWAPDGSRSQGKIFFYGPAGAVGGIVELYRYLEAQLVVISAAATAMRRERRVHGRTWRNSFLLGAVGRVGQRLDARRAETAEAGENGRALVLVKTAVDREIERRHPELQSSRLSARRWPAARMRPAATRASTSILGTAGSGTARRRSPTPQRDERPTTVARGAVPDVWRARRAALPDQPLQRQALAGAARCARLAAAIVPDLQGAGG